MDAPRSDPKNFVHGQAPETAWTVERSTDAALNRLSALSFTEPETFRGQVLDYDARAVVVFLDSDLSGAQRDEARREAFLAADERVPVRFASSCFSARRISEAKRAIHDPARVKMSPNSMVAGGLRPATGRLDYYVTTEALAQQVRAVLGDVAGNVEVRPDLSLLSGTRLADTSPHYAGARLNRNEVGHCTSGFTVQTATGKRTSTAAHCLVNGFNVTNFANGANAYYGQGAQYSLNDPDIASIRDSSQTYTNAIWTGGGDSVASRTVTGKWTQPPASYCLSGSFTGFVCNTALEDANDDLQYAGSDGVTRHVFNLIFVRNTAGQNIARGGDSGGPALGRPTATTADARGMIVAGFRDGGTTAWLQNIGSVESYLGASIATSCCAQTSP